MTYHPSNLHKLFAKGSPEAIGFEDALRGHTANPFGRPDAAAKWREGYAYARDNGLARLPSFAELTRGISRFNKRRRK